MGLSLFQPDVLTAIARPEVEITNSLALDEMCEITPTLSAQQVRG